MWQVMQSAAEFSPSILTFEGKLTPVRAPAAGLWQAVQVTPSLPITGLFTTPAGLPSVPKKSRKPLELWQAAQVTGIPAGAALFQWVNAAALTLAWGDCCQATALSAAISAVVVQVWD